MIPYFEINDAFQVIYRKSGSSSPVTPHIHNGIELYYTLSDLPDVLLKDTVSGVSKGSLIAIPPFCIHQLFNQKLTVYERYIISINHDWLSALLQNRTDVIPYADSADSPLILPLDEQQQSELTALLEGFLAADSQDLLSYYAASLKLFATLNQMIRAKEVSVAHTRSSVSAAQCNVNTAISYINAHLTESLSLEQIAEHCHLNKDYLGRLFKEHTHSTIGHYISLQRISLAQKMLSQGMTVSQVQEALGFSSYAYFFRFFQKYTGESPSRWAHGASSGHSSGHEHPL